MIFCFYSFKGSVRVDLLLYFASQRCYGLQDLLEDALLVFLLFYEDVQLVIFRFTGLQLRQVTSALHTLLIFNLCIINIALQVGDLLF